MLTAMAPHQRLLHAALGVARDVASRSGVAAGACSHLRERIVSGPLCLAAGRHITCASYHSQVAAAEPLAIRATAGELSGDRQMYLRRCTYPSPFRHRTCCWLTPHARERCSSHQLTGWRARIAASSVATLRCGCDTHAAGISSEDEADSVAAGPATADGVGASSALPALRRRTAPWQTTAAAVASSFSAFRPTDPDGHTFSAGSRHPRHVFIAHRRLSTAAAGTAAASRHSGSQLGGSQAVPRAAPATATVPASNEAGDGSGTAQEAGTQQSPPLNGQLVHPSRDFVYEGPLSVPVRRLKVSRDGACLLGKSIQTAGAEQSIHDAL